MLVIHPNDRSTKFLELLYDKNQVSLIDGNISRGELNHVFHRTSPQERILLLGHGSSKGLYWRADDTKPEFDGIVVGHQHAFHLRNHGTNLVAVFCHADDFFLSERLHGLSTGMFISEIGEAIAYRVETTAEEIERENVKFVQRLKGLLDSGIPLHEIPAKIRKMDDVHSPLTEFNYNNVYYL